MAVVWDATNIGPSLVRSGSNLVVTNPHAVGNQWQCVIADTGKSSGKLYWEIVLGAMPNDGTVNGGSMQIGFAKNDQNYNSFMGASGNDGWVRADMATFDGAGDGGVTYATGNRGFTTATTGDVLGFAIDLGAGKCWVAKNNSFGGNPGAGTNPAWTWSAGGTWYPCWGSNSGPAPASNDPAATLHAVDTQQTYSPPSGFSAWEVAAGGGGFFSRVYYDMLTGRGRNV